MLHYDNAIFVYFLWASMLFRLWWQKNTVKRSFAPRLLWLFVFAFSTVLPVTSHAYQRSYTNLGFETPSIATAAPCRVYITNTKVPGWLTTHSFFQEEGSPNGGTGNCGTGVVNHLVVSGQILEIWKGPRDNDTGGLPISAREGTQFAELNANEITEMSQNVCLVNGEPVTWKLSHNGRNSTDSMAFRAGTQAIANVSTSPTGVGVVTCLSGTCAVSSQVTNVSGNGPRWADYSGTFTYTGASGQTVLGFQSTSGTATTGNFLDAIQITVKPIIEFTSANYSIPENSLNPPPIQVVVAGIVPVGGIVLTFNVTGGTAILGSDYTVNGGSATTFNVTLPAGDYGQGTPLIVNVPVSIIDDTTNEPDENFTVTIAPDVNKFHLMSTSVCGASGNGTATYTIIDDDAPQDFDVSVVKSQRAGTSGTFSTNPLTVTSGTVQYQLVMTNKGVKTITAGAPATFSDVVPANVSLVATNFSFVGGGGATSCTASRSGNTVTGSFSGPTNATCTVIMQGTASTTGTITNTATTAVPVGNNDIFPSDNSSSVVTNIARATLTLNKISNGSIGTFGFTLTNTTQNSGNSVTTTIPGGLTQVDGNTSTGGIQPFTISAAGDITINESTIPSGWALASAACTNAAGASVGSLSGTTYTIPSASNVSGEVFSCNFLNNRPPTIKVEKISYGGAAGFTFADTNLTGSIGTLTTVSSGAGVTSAALPVSLVGTNVTITETLVAGYTLTSASCVDENSALTGKIGTFGTLAGNTLTVPSSYFVTGADIKCTFHNRRSTTLTLRKTWAAGSQAGHTATVTSSGFINNATSGASTATAVGNTTTGTATTVYVGESGSIGETFAGGAVAADYNSVLACTGTNGSLSGNTLTVTQSTGTAIVCTYTNTKRPKITLTKISHGGVGAFSFTGDNGFTNQTITTVASGTGVAGTTQTLAAASTATTITETIPAGYEVTAINCTGLGSSGGTATPNLATGSVVLNAAATAAGNNIACTFTNTKQPLLRIHKTVSSLVDANDRFTTEIRTVSATGTVVSTTGSSLTTGGGVLTTGGAATYNATGKYEGAVGTQYFITESITPGTSVLGRYTTSISCTNAYAGNPTATVLPSGITTPFTITPQQGDDITCTLTNQLKQPTVTISKVSTGAVGTFNFSNANLSSASSALMTTVVSTPVNTAALTVTNRNNNVTVQETVPANWTLTSVNCIDNNAAVTGNPASFGTLVGSQITILPANLQVGADIVCTFTNRKTAQLTLRKTWVNAQVNDAVTITTAGGSVNPSFASVANTANETDTSTATAVYVGDTLTFTEPFSTGSASNYNANLACTGATDTNLADGLTINTADSAITCTYTNTRKTATFRLAKAWGANSISGNVANLGATTGLTNNTTAFTSTASTNTTGTSVTVYAGETVTLPAETMSTGTLSNYNTVLSCTADAGATANSLSGTNGQSSNTLTIGAGDEGKVVTCTYTNTRIAQSLTIAKQWTNAATGHTATVTTTGGTNNSTFNSTAPSTGLTGTTVTVYAGDVVTLPAETFGGGASASIYSSTVACTGGTTLASGAVGRNITISNTTTATTCTYSNTGLSDMVPTLTYMPNTGIVGSPYYGKFTCTNNGIAPATAGATCAISLPAGLSATCSPTVPTAGTVAVGASINCTVTGTPTTSGSGTFVLTTGATNDSNGGTTTGGNNQVSQAITIVDSTIAPTCSPGSTTNLLSSAGTELYFADNTATPITNNFGLIGSPASYVRTGSNFVVKGNWRWRNANPAAGSPAMTYQLIVNGTVYAQLVGTPSGQEVGTLTALNGATLDGGLSTMQLYDFSVSGLAALPVGVTLPSTVTSISTLSMSFVSSTTPADDAGLAPTILNACALPKLTLSKVSQGGVGAFAFTGNNGFSNETITTTVAGTSVAGTTQTLSAVSTTTTISETIPSGYNVTDISCTGLGSGNATPNLVTGSVVISDSALVYGANIACTYTNTKLPTITISKISQGGIGSFSFTGTNGFVSQNITTSSAGVAVAGATQTLSAAATATTITETIPSGYTVTDISCTGLGAGSATPNLVGGSVSLNAAATAAGANIACTFTNTASAFTITGKVFLDNGKNSATPHNGIQEVDELGIGNISLRLTDCATTVYQLVTTDGAGDYEFTIPTSLSAGASLCVEEYQQPSNLVSVSGSAGSTGGSYSLASDRTQFTLALNTSYSAINFGDVVQSQLTGTGNQTIPAGTTASYGHQFIAGTEGAVTFSTAQAPTPLLAWTSLVYLDANCNALLDGGDTQITSAINVVADQVVCLVQKVISPSTATNGSQNVSTLSASFVYAAPSAIIGNYSQPDTTLIMDGGLVLVKKVREVSSCPSTGADSNLFTTNNQALPNAFIEYQIVYSNPSANVVSNIVINDMTPSFTTFRSASCRTTPSSVLCSVTSSPSVGGVGSLQWVLTDNPVGLGSGQSGEVRFCVRVDQ